MIRYNIVRKLTSVILVCTALLSGAAQSALACTGITLKAQDGAVVFGRTMEWGSFDLNSRVAIVPRGYAFQGSTPDGQNGLAWKTKYGAVGLDALGKDIVLDGMNEKGLTVNLFYHPGYAQYPKYDPAKAKETLGPLDLCQYLLTTCATVADARKTLSGVRVTGIVEPSLGIPPAVHFMVTEPSGKAIVIEFANGGTQIYDAPLGVITNAPTYDWHITNLRNYLNLSAVSLPNKKLEDLNFSPLGGGSGMIGLPGDFTPPSRFVRAVAFSKSARPTPTGEETMYELFRILDNFNVPLGAAEGEGEAKTKGMRSSTLWTSAYDTKNLIMQYHTQHDRRVRQIDLKKIDFATPRGLVHQPLDIEKSQDIQDVTPMTR